MRDQKQRTCPVCKAKKKPQGFRAHRAACQNRQKSVNVAPPDAGP